MNTLVTSDTKGIELSSKYSITFCVPVRVRPPRITLTYHIKLEKVWLVKTSRFTIITVVR